MTIPLLIDLMRNGHFQADVHLLSASIALPPGESRDFVTELSYQWFAQKAEDDFQDPDEIKEDLERDTDFIQEIIDDNPMEVAAAFESDGSTRAIVSLMSATAKTNLRNALKEGE